MRIYSTGRAEPQRVARWSAAPVHEFVSSAVTNSHPSGRQVQQPVGTAATVAPSQADVFVGFPKKSLDQEYAIMAVTLQAEKVTAARDSRAARKRVLQQKGLGTSSSSRAADRPRASRPTRGGIAATGRRETAGPGKPPVPGASARSGAHGTCSTGAARTGKRPRQGPATASEGAASASLAASDDGPPATKRATPRLPRALIDNTTPFSSALASGTARTDHAAPSLP